MLLWFNENNFLGPKNSMIILSDQLLIEKGVQNRRNWTNEPHEVWEMRGYVKSYIS